MTEMEDRKGECVSGRLRRHSEETVKGSCSIREGRKEGNKETRRGKTSALSNITWKTTVVSTNVKTRQRKTLHLSVCISVIVPFVVFKCQPHIADILQEETTVSLCVGGRLCSGLKRPDLLE